ncbi:hypothetical protein VNO78_21782 [Psophocarpus tetragonolobus]|uniref:Non-specific lipid-transfer protein n=1 Tax=Psophocarpus tetragonolobus TaxID=3891 RepID=A0AAN9XHW4_PSOTE
MGEKKVLALVMLVMTYGLAVTRFSSCQIPPTCNGYEPLLTQCVSYLVVRGPATPSARCCDGARESFAKANNPQAIKNLCSCLNDAGPYLLFQNDNLAQLPGACNIQLSFDINKCVYGN